MKIRILCLCESIMFNTVRIRNSIAAPLSYHGLLKYILNNTFPSYCYSTRTHSSLYYWSDWFLASSSIFILQHHLLSVLEEDEDSTAHSAHITAA
jgi:hypothetical protein